MKPPPAGRLRRAKTFINCTAPPSPRPTYTTQAPAFMAHRFPQTAYRHTLPSWASSPSLVAHEHSQASRWEASHGSGGGPAPTSYERPAASKFAPGRRRSSPSTAPHRLSGLVRVRTIQPGIADAVPRSPQRKWQRRVPTCGAAYDEQQRMFPHGRTRVRRTTVGGCVTSP